MKLWCPAPDSRLSPWGIRNCGTSRDLKSMCTVAFVFSWNPKATMWRSPWMMSYTWPRHSCYPDLRLDNHQTCDWGHLRSLIHKPTCWFTTTPEWTPQWSMKLTQTTVWPTHEIVSWIIGGCYKHCVLGYRQQQLPAISLLDSFTKSISLCSPQPCKTGGAGVLPHVQMGGNWAPRKHNELPNAKLLKNLKVRSRMEVTLTC